MPCCSSDEGEDHDCEASEVVCVDSQQDSQEGPSAWGPLQVGVASLWAWRLSTRSGGGDVHCVDAAFERRRLKNHEAPLI